MEILIKSPELEALSRKILSGLATRNDLSAAKLEDVRAIKSDTGEIHYRANAEPMERKPDDPVRSRRYVASDETVDRMGDIIRVKGWDLSNFRKNPQALWAHNSRALPIGTVTEMDKGELRGSPALLETITYLEQGLDPAADAVWKLVNAGVVRAVSVGFLPVQTRFPDSPEERQELGLGDWGVLYEKQEQLELSNCTIPANPSALATRTVKEALRGMIARGEITERDADAVVELGEQRKIQIQVPDLTSITASGTNDVFTVTEGGKLQRSAAVEPKKNPVVDQLEVLDALGMVADEISQLRNDLAGIDSKIEAAVGRALRDPRKDMRRTLEAAVERVGQRLAKETV